MDSEIRGTMKDCLKESIRLVKEIYEEEGFEFPKEVISSISATLFIETMKRKSKERKN